MGFVSGAGIAPNMKGTVSHEILHVTDWYVPHFLIRAIVLKRVDKIHFSIALGRKEPILEAYVGVFPSILWYIPQVSNDCSRDRRLGPQAYWSALHQSFSPTGSIRWIQPVVTLRKCGLSHTASDLIFVSPPNSAGFIGRNDALRT